MNNPCEECEADDFDNHKPSCSYACLDCHTTLPVYGYNRRCHSCNYERECDKADYMYDRMKDEGF